MSDKSREYYSVTQMVQELIDSVEELTEEIEEVDPSAIDAKITAVDAKVARNAADIETNEGLITQLQVRATADEQAITGLDSRVAKLEEGGTAGGYTVTTETYALDVSAGTGSTKVTFEDMKNGGFVIIQPYDDDARETLEKSVEVKVTQEFALLPTYTFTYDTKGREVYYIKFLIIKATKKDDTTLKTINRVPRYLNTAWSGSTLVPSVDLITWNNDSITAVSATDYPEVTELTLPYYKPDTTDKAYISNGCSFSFNNITTLNVLTSYYNSSGEKNVYLPATITKLRFNYFPLIHEWTKNVTFVIPRDCSDIEWSHFNADGVFKNVFSTSLNAQLIVKNHIEDFNSLNAIKAYMFYNCPDVNLEITQDMFTGANSINKSAFEGSSIKSVYSKATRVYSYAFKDCKSLTSVNLPDCAFVDSYAFENCSNLKKILIPNCTSIGSGPFKSCTIEVFDSSLKNINASYTYITKAFISRADSVCDFTTILKDSSGCILYVPDDLYDSYIASETYVSYIDRIKKISEYTE